MAKLSVQLPTASNFEKGLPTDGLTPAELMECLGQWEECPQSRVRAKSFYRMMEVYFSNECQLMESQGMQSFREKKRQRKFLEDLAKAMIRIQNQENSDDDFEGIKNRISNYLRTRNTTITTPNRDDYGTENSSPLEESDCTPLHSPLPLNYSVGLWDELGNPDDSAGRFFDDDSWGEGSEFVAELAEENEARTQKLQRIMTSAFDTLPLATYDELFGEQSCGSTFALPKLGLTQKGNSCDMEVQLNMLHFYFAVVDLYGSNSPLVLSESDFCSFLRCDPWDLAYRSVFSLAAPTTPSAMLKELEDTISRMKSSESQETASCLVTFNTVRKDSSRISILLHGRPLIFAETQFLLLAIADVSHLTNLDTTCPRQRRVVSQIINNLIASGAVHSALRLCQ